MAIRVHPWVWGLAASGALLLSAASVATLSGAMVNAEESLATSVPLGAERPQPSVVGAAVSLSGSKVVAGSPSKARQAPRSPLAGGSQAKSSPKPRATPTPTETSTPTPTDNQAQIDALVAQVADFDGQIAAASAAVASAQSQLDALVANGQGDSADAQALSTQIADGNAQVASLTASRDAAQAQLVQLRGF
ncbi:MAG TPA: hypothetical protein VK139_07945 [Microbacteriaceae bacterium]|nr:hypothetical protein [Microbacteriaceae bacterium]